jgi:hypothetical protein
MTIYAEFPCGARIKASRRFVADAVKAGRDTVKTLFGTPHVRVAVWSPGQTQDRPINRDGTRARCLSCPMDGRRARAYRREFRALIGEWPADGSRPETGIVVTCHAREIDVGDAP